MLIFSEHPDYEQLCQIYAERRQPQTFLFDGFLYRALEHPDGLRFQKRAHSMEGTYDKNSIAPSKRI